MDKYNEPHVNLCFLKDKPDTSEGVILKQQIEMRTKINTMQRIANIKNKN